MSPTCPGPKSTSQRMPYGPKPRSCRPCGTMRAPEPRDERRRRQVCVPGLRGTMRRITLLTLLLGAGVFIALILGTGVDAIRDALAPVGWGILAIILSHLIPILLDVAAWRLLFPNR